MQAIGPRALDVQGTATFDRSGVDSIAYPAKSAVVTVPGAALSATSAAFAVLQSHLTGVFVASAVPTVGTNTLTGYLNRAPGSANAPRTAAFAWFVLG